MPTEKRELMEDMKLINLSVESEMNKILTAMGLTAAQGYVLIYILEHPETEMNSTRIHKKMEVSRATVSGLIKKLRCKGYLEFQSCASDDRRKLIVTTEKAMDLKNVLRQHIEQATEQIYADFSAADLAVMDKLQKRVLSNLHCSKTIRLGDPIYEKDINATWSL